MKDTSNSRAMHLTAITGFFTIMILVVAAFAFDAHAQMVRDDDGNVTLEGTVTDVQFLAGKSVLIKATVDDDVFAAGRDVTLEGAVLKKAILAGNDVEQRGGTVADMIAAANTLVVGGTVEGDLVAFGRTIRVAPAGSLGGDGRVAAERIEIEGRIAGSLRAAGRYVAINGEVGGKVDLIAKRIVIGPNAVIAGDLVYRSGAKPEIAEGARIEGSLREVESKLPEMKSLLRTIVGIGITLIALWVVAGLATVAIMALAFPAVIGNAAVRLRAHPWSSLSRGIVILFAAVVLAILFFVTIVAIPLGATLAVAIVVLKLFGLVTVSACIGLWLRGLIRRSAGEAGKAGRIGWTVIGTIVVGIVMLIPFVGTAVSGLAVVAGAGASATELWTRLRAAG